MPVFDDIVELFDYEMIKLRNMYQEHLPEVSFAYNAINIAIETRKKYVDKNYYTIFGIDNRWEDHGGFVLLAQCKSYDLFIFSLKENQEKIHHALLNTKKIDWNKKRVFVYSISEKFSPYVIKALNSIRGGVDKLEQMNTWWISKEKAINYEIQCPPDVYIAKLTPNDAVLVNKEWPNKFENSEEFVRCIIKTNGGIGVFLKSTGKLAAWVLKNHVGILGLLQTVHEHKKRGYASLVTMAMSKEMAEKGEDTLSTVLVSNFVSNNLFKKLGFKIIDQSYNIALYNPNSA